jgi:ADP-heptose:LPS heptosyltransferase
VDKRALLIRFSSLGDVVLTSCLFEPLIKRGYKPYLLTHPPYGEPFLEDPRVEVIQIRKDELFNRLDLLRGFDLYLDLHKNLKTFILRLLLRGSWKSYPKESLRRRLALRFPIFRKPYSVVSAYLKAIGKKATDLPFLYPKRGWSCSKKTTVRALWHLDRVQGIRKRDILFLES